MLRRAQHDKNAGRPAPVEGRSWQRVFGLLLLLPILTACLGRATPPEQVKLTQAQNEVLGKFARQVGERELNILLKDPNDTTLPGIPVGDLLYILSRVNEDKLIRLVKGISATTTLELILAIKRVGCTRYDAIFPGNNFDARSVASMNQCTWQHFHLPNLMVQLLNGVNDQGLQTLIDTVNHSYVTLNCASNGSGKLAANQPLCPASTMVTTQPITTAATDTFNTQPYKVTIDHYSYLMKLAYIVVGFDTPSASDPNLASPNLVGPTKLYNLMNLTLDGRDMAYLLDSFDSNTVNLSRKTPQTFCPAPPGTTTSNCVYIDTTVPTAPVYNTYDAAGNLWRDICPTLLPNNACDPTVLGVQLQGLRNLLSLIDNINDTSKLGTLLNGRRTTRNDTSQDTGQIRYFTDRLRVVIEHIGGTGPYCPTGGPYAPFTVDTTLAIPQQDLQCAYQDFTAPQGGNTEWNSKLAGMINNVANIPRLRDLIYQVDDGFDPATHKSIASFPHRGIDNLLVLLNNLNPNAVHPAPGNSELLTASYLIDNVTPDPLPSPGNPLLAKRNRVSYLVQYMGSTFDVLKLACYTAAQSGGTAGAACFKKGLINQASRDSKVDDLAVPDLSAAGQKLANLMDNVSEIEDMRFIIRKVDMSQLTQIVAGLQINGTLRTAQLINQISGTDCWATPTDASGAAQPLAGVLGATVTPGVGTPYTGQVAVTLPGGATGKALLNASNRVAGIVVLTEGSGIPYGTNPAITIMDPGGGTGSTATAITGRCVYNAPNDFRGFPTPTSTGATGLGKIVNVINHITGSPGTIVTLINGVTDGAKLGILINGVNRSSNLVGVMNAVVDPNRNNNATINDLINLMNTLSHEDVVKLVHIIENLGDAREVTALLTVPSADHDLVAQLMAPYNSANINTTSGLGWTAMADLVGNLDMTGGTGYTNGATITISGGATATIVTTATGAVSGATITNPGTGYTDNPTTCTVSGGTGAVLKCVASGSIASLNSYYGGSGYTTGDVCPIRGAGGSGATCTVIASGGELTGCSAIGFDAGFPPGGINYADDRIVKIGGRAEAVANVVGGVIQSVVVTSAGCGYTATPAVYFEGCATQPTTVTVNMSGGATGSVTGITVTPDSSGCPVGAKVVIGENPFVAFADGATAIVGTISNGSLAFVSVSEPAVNAAQLIQLIDRDATGITSGTRGFSITYNGSTPNISAREAMVRLLHHGVTIPAGSAKGYFSEGFGLGSVVDVASDGIADNLKSGVALGGAGVWTNAYAVNFPGLGPQFIADSILNNLSGVEPTQTLINMLNTNTIDLTDTLLLLGCGDRSTYTNAAVTPFTWQQLCTQLGPGLW